MNCKYKQRFEFSWTWKISQKGLEMFFGPYRAEKGLKIVEMDKKALKLV